MNPSSPIPAIAELRAESDISILEYIALRSEDEATAKIAFQVFYERYEPYLFGIARRVCAQFPGSANELFESVWQNTFMKVYERAGTFNTEAIRATDVTAGIKAWLGKIADNEHKRLLRQLKKRPALHVVEDVAIFEDGLESDAEVVDAETVSYERGLLDQALASLTERERYILLQSLAYEREGEYLPSDFIESTCTLWDITKPNFRKIKSLALQKVKAKIAHLQALSN